MRSNRKAFFTEALCIVGILLSSYYLTFITDVYTLNTWPERIFVFLYFAVVSVLASKIVRKRFGAVNIKTAVSAVLLASVFLFAFHSNLIPNWEAQEVVLRANVSEDYPTGEVWLVSAELDGQWIEPSQLNELTASGWIFSSEYDDYIFFPNEDGATNELRFCASAQTVILRFATNPWSGSVLIEEDGKTNLFDLQSEEPQEEPLIYTISTVHERSLLEWIVLYVGALIVFSYILSVLLSVVLRKVTQRRVIAAAIFLISESLLFCSFPLICIAV